MINRLGCASLAALIILGACAHEAGVPMAQRAPAGPATATTETFSVRLFGQTLGQLVAIRTGDTVSVDYEYRNNGRGPTLAETIRLGPDGLPVSWTIRGTTTFGNQIQETFSLEGGVASWTDTTGSSAAAMTGPTIYVPQNASPYAFAVYAGALLADADGSLPAWPAGTLSISPLETVRLEGAGGPVEAAAYALVGNDTDPGYFLLDE
ncbi:MAG: hypothetical protein ACO33A_06265 [Hyphomonas sp.]